MPLLTPAHFQCTAAVGEFAENYWSGRIAGLKSWKGLATARLQTRLNPFTMRSNSLGGSLKPYDRVLFEVLAGRFIFASAFNLSAQR